MLNQTFKYVIMNEFGDPIGVVSHYIDANQVITLHENLAKDTTSFEYTPSKSYTHWIVRFYDAKQQKHREFELIKVKEF